MFVMKIKTAVGMVLVSLGLLCIEALVNVTASAAGGQPETANTAHAAEGKKKPEIGKWRFYPLVGPARLEATERFYPMVGPARRFTLVPLVLGSSADDSDGTTTNPKK